MSDEVEEVTEEIETKAEDTKTAEVVEEKVEAKSEAKTEEHDWRSVIADDKLKEHAGRFNSLDDVIRANLESRQKLSKAIVKPGKDASEDEISAYRKAMNIPETPEDYGLTPTEDATEEQKASLDRWTKVFHEKGIPKDVASDLVEEVRKEAEEAQKAQVEADERHAKEQTAALENEWGAEFEKNKAFGDRALTALADRAGVDIEELRHMETKEGRFILDDARFARIFATIGREMGEGDLGPVSSGDVDRINDQIEDIRTKISEAQDKGNTRRANELYQQEQALLAKLGNKPAVGAQGRAA